MATLWPAEHGEISFHKKIYQQTTVLCMKMSQKLFLCGIANIIIMMIIIIIIIITMQS